MEKFKFVDITSADVAFEAYGKDLNELFANAALAMFEVMINTKLIMIRILSRDMSLFFLLKPRVFRC
jgi:SHS2 domain-containing protein